MNKSTKANRKVIIAGFPGIGKSYCGEHLDSVIDLESSDFHWIIDPNGEKQLHPAWPDNYISAIKLIANETSDIRKYDCVQYVACSTHKTVIERLIQDKIGFVIIAPKTKSVYIQRYIDIGSSEEFIKSLDENWDSYMNDLKSYIAPVIYTDEFLNTIIDHNSYKYLLNKIECTEKFLYGEDWLEDE